MHPFGKEMMKIATEKTHKHQIVERKSITVVIKCLCESLLLSSSFVMMRVKKSSLVLVGNIRSPSQCSHKSHKLICVLRCCLLSLNSEVCQDLWEDIRLHHNRKLYVHVVLWRSFIQMGFGSFLNSQLFTVSIHCCSFSLLHTRTQQHIQFSSFPFFRRSKELEIVAINGGRKEGDKKEPLDAGCWKRLQKKWREEWSQCNSSLSGKGKGFFHFFLFVSSTLAVNCLFPALLPSSLQLLVFIFLLHLFLLFQMSRRREDTRWEIER